jgi:hypothetical protein
MRRLVIGLESDVDQIAVASGADDRCAIALLEKIPAANDRAALTLQPAARAYELVDAHRFRS